MHSLISLIADVVFRTLLLYLLSNFLIAPWAQIAPLTLSGAFGLTLFITAITADGRMAAARREGE